MKRIKAAIALLFLINFSAIAADLPSIKSAPVTTPAPLWTGFYAGLNLGGGWNASSGVSGVTILDAWNGQVYNGANGNGGSGGVIGGGQIGYNYQVKSGIADGVAFVLGGEADIQGSTMASGSSGNSGCFKQADGSVVCNIPGPGGGTFCAPPPGQAYCQGGGAGIPWFGTARARAGLTLTPQLLAYATGGFAYAQVSQHLAGVYNFRSVFQTGWTAGGGLEWMFMPNWSAKAEYLYTEVYGGNSGNYPNIALTSVKNYTGWNTVRAGVNYHFNFANVAPVVVKY